MVDGMEPSPWLGADRIFTTPEFLRRYDEVEISLFTPKVTLVPELFFREDQARELLSGVAKLSDSDQVSFVNVPQVGAVLVYSNSIGEALSRMIAQTVCTVGGQHAEVLPELYYLLQELWAFPEYNKIIASYRDGYLYLCIASGKTLLLCNSFEAMDFTTAEYFIFYSLKKLQLNPELSSIRFRTPLSAEEELSLYRYFKSVERV